MQRVSCFFARRIEPDQITLVFVLAVKRRGKLKGKWSPIRLFSLATSEQLTSAWQLFFLPSERSVQLEPCSCRLSFLEI